MDLIKESITQFIKFLYKNNIYFALPVTLLRLEQQAS